MAGDFDVIVVGSGPGGATVARALTGAGARVLIVGTDVDFVDLALGRGEAGAATRAN